MDPELVNIALGLGGIIIGIVASYVFYQLSVERKDPRWTAVGNNLISDFGSEWDKLSITYDQQPVKNLSVSKVAIWNAGKATIERADLTEIEPLRICIPKGVDLLDARLLAQNNQANCCAIETDTVKGTVAFNFDYLDQGNGFVVQVVHTGVVATDLELLGAIKGVRRVRRTSRISPIPIKEGYETTALVFGGLVIALIVAWYLLGGNSLPGFAVSGSAGELGPRDPIVLVVMAVFGILVFAVALFGGYSLHYFTQKTFSIPPKELRKYLE